MKFVQQRNSSMELRLLVFEVVGSLILLAAEFFFKLRMVTPVLVTLTLQKCGQNRFQAVERRRNLAQSFRAWLSRVVKE